MATREDLKTIPYTLFTPDEQRKALNDLAATGVPIANKQEFSDAFGGVVVAGKNTVDYGQGRNQNFINVLASFASEEGGTPGFPDPLLIPNPLVGQSWYDLTAGTLKIFNGSVWATSATGAEAGDLSFDDTNTTIVATDIQTAIEELDEALFDHINDPTDAHDASAISNVPAGSISATNVQDAIDELENEIDGTQATGANNADNFSDHLTIFPSHSADMISNQPLGSISALNVQDAIDELETELDATQSATSSNTSLINGHISDGSGAHAATAISYNNAVSGLAATNVKTAIDEIAAGGLGSTLTFEGPDRIANTAVIHTENLPAGFGPDGPDLVQIVAECVIADIGYSVGDITYLNEQANQFDEASNADDEFAYIVWNAASPLQITWLFNNVEKTDRMMMALKGALFHQNGVLVTSPARWKLRLRAFKF